MATDTFKAGYQAEFDKKKKAKDLQATLRKLGPGVANKDPGAIAAAQDIGRQLGALESPVASTPIATTQQSTGLNPEQAAAQARQATAPLISNAGSGIAPRQNTPDQTARINEQRNAIRGPETQTTRFGAFDASGNQLRGTSNQRNQASAGIAGGSRTPDASGTGASSGTFSVTGGGDPIAQLAKLREIRGEPSSSGGVTFIPNSYARERNARISDPNNILIDDLSRQVRLGNIAPKNAFRIAQDAIAQSQNAALGQEKLAQSDIQAKLDLAQKDRALSTQENIARAKLQGDLSSSELDRLSKERIAAASGSTDAQKLALDQAKFLESSAVDRARLGLDTQKAATAQQSSIAKLFQEGQIAANKGDQTFIEFAGKLGEQLNSGLITKDTIRGLAQAYPKLGLLLLPEEYTNN